MSEKTSPVSCDEAVRAEALALIGCPYVYGGTGEFCTVKYRKARAAQYPKYANKISANCPRMSGKKNTCQGCRWWDESTRQGKRALDCAQLALRCMKAAGIKLVSGANSQWSKTDWLVRGEIADLPRGRVAQLFRKDGTKMGHTGIYLGDETIVHAKGHDFGVVREALGVPKFTHFGIPRGLYAGADAQTLAALPLTLKKGCLGQAVKEMQEMLILSGHALPRYGADGSFGSETESALIAFQQAAGLAADGVAGAETLARLRAAAGIDPKEAREENATEAAPGPADGQETSAAADAEAEAEAAAAALEAFLDAIETARKKLLAMAAALDLMRAQAAALRENGGQAAPAEEIHLAGGLIDEE